MSGTNCDRLQQELAELRHLIETEWFNGNITESARDRLLAPPDGDQ